MPISWKIVSPWIVYVEDLTLSSWECDFFFSAIRSLNTIKEAINVDTNLIWLMSFIGTRG